MNDVLFGCGRVVDVLELFVLRVSGVDDRPREFYPGSLFCLAQRPHAMNRMVAGGKGVRLVARLAVVIFGHVTLGNWAARSFDGTARHYGEDEQPDGQPA